MIYRLVIFLVLNFTALAIGSFLMGEGSSSGWYQSLNKAPWTPPGWVFGFAWASIMISFSFYMTKLTESKEIQKNAIVLFTLQWVFNVSWNPTFFYYHQTVLALAVIILLTFLITYFLVKYRKRQQIYSILILPYFLWLLIATSLNFYIVLYN